MASRRHPVMTLHLGRVEIISRGSGNISHASQVVPIAVSHALRHLGVVVDSMKLMRWLLLKLRLMLIELLRLLLLMLLVTLYLVVGSSSDVR